MSIILGSAIERIVSGECALCADDERKKGNLEPKLELMIRVVRIDIHSASFATRVSRLSITFARPS